MGTVDFVGKLQSMGIRALYHITDKDNLISIIKERSLYSWSGALDAGISVLRPGGNPVTHRLDARVGRDRYVHLLPHHPTDRDFLQFINQGRFGELFALEIKLEALKEGRVVFWLGDPYSDGERIDDVELLSERIQADPDLLNVLSVDALDSIHYSYLLNIPEDVESRISEVHPTAIVFVIDQSRSMSRGAEINNVEYDYISEVAAESVNTLIEHFLRRCISAQGEVNRLYDIAVIGYGDDVRNGWNGELADSDMHSPIELLAHTQTRDERFRWVDPKDDDSKSRSDLALEHVYELLGSWVKRKENRYSYPPTVIHVSDGGISTQYQNGFLKAAEKLKRLSTENGNLILWNIGISPFRSKEYVLLSGEELPILFHHGTDSTLLYEASSYLPPRFKEIAAPFHGGDPALERRTMAVNLAPDKLVRLLQLCILPEQDRFSED